MLNSNKLLILIFIGLCLIGIKPGIGMTFEIQERCIDGIEPRCQPVILGIGFLDKDAANSFKSVAQRVPKGSWVALSSQGGNLISGLQLGMAIRELGLNTTIGSTDYSPLECYSACAYAFLGGQSRYIPNGGRYGLHQFKGQTKEINQADTQKISVILANYLDRMGVDRRLLDYALVTSTDRMTVLSLAQAKILQVDNIGQSPSARWRIEAVAGGQLVLINQAMFVKERIPVTLGFMNADGKIFSIIFYSKNDFKNFQSNGKHDIQIGQELHSLNPITKWQEKERGYQSIFQVSEKLIDQISELPEDSFFKLKVAHLNEANEALFGVKNFKRSIQALIKK
jgi:hypothetical protein